MKLSDIDELPERLYCPKCQRVVTLRKDGTIPNHKLFRFRNPRAAGNCPASRTSPDDWRTTL